MTRERRIRPPRPLPLVALRQAFLREVLDDALADGFVAMCPAVDGEEIGFVLTPKGEAWLREFPADMLPLGDGCARRA